MKTAKALSLERKAGDLQARAAEIREQAALDDPATKKLRRKADRLREQLKKVLMDIEDAKTRAKENAKAKWQPLEAEAEVLLKEARGFSTAEHVAKFSEALWRGVNWGTKFVCVWQAEPFAIIRRPGYTYATSRLGRDSYFPPEWWLVNTRLAKGKWGLDARDAALMRKHEGKMPKGKLEQWVEDTRAALKAGKDRLEPEHEIPDDVQPLKR